MYRHGNQLGRQKRNFSRQNGRSQRGQRKFKSFDPTGLVNSPPTRFEEIPRYTVSHSFSDFQISGRLKENISLKGYKIPTPIQDQTIPPILKGRDLIGIANTGTGKTAAFLIPLIQKVATNPKAKVLIVAPTRELAMQTKDEFIGFSKNLGIYCALCIGGANIKTQVKSLMRNPNFVIGTPGRILDLIRSQNLNLSHFSSVVLDEADRMVDIGFVQDIKYIISLLSKDRQSLFFSATIDGEAKEILTNFVVDPVTVSVKTQDTSENVIQNIVKVPEQSMKLEKLHELLIQKGFEKVLVFGRTKHGVQKLSDKLNKRGFRADAIHGNKRQAQRTRTLERFKRNEVHILIATDVASRGLDIPNVSHIINYDLPESKDAYIHRIGRTGRAGKRGFALTFVE